MPNFIEEMASLPKMLDDLASDDCVWHASHRPNEGGVIE